MRVLIWSQHLLGTGHLQRSARLADALAARGHAVVLANGGPAPARAPEAYRRIDLPAIRAADDRFDGLVDGTGRPVGEALWAERLERLEALGRDPFDAVIVEMFPFGRRAFTRELAPLLDRWRARPRRPRLIVSVRDILVEKARPERALEAACRVERWFDRVLVHADPRLVRLDDTFAPARRIAGRLRYTGYVAPALASPLPSSERRGVVVSAGGGAVGRALLGAALGAAQRLGDVAGPWTLITGRGLDEADWTALRRDAPESVELLRHVDDLPRRLARAALSLSQAGYNTVVEAMAARCPMVLVPFATGAETEQTRRAEAAATAGAAVLVAEAELTPERLAAALTARLATPFPPLTLDVDGASRSARLVEDMVGGRA